MIFFLLLVFLLSQLQFYLILCGSLSLGLVTGCFLYILSCDSIGCLFEIALEYVLEVEWREVLQGLSRKGFTLGLQGFTRVLLYYKHLIPSHLFTSELMEEFSSILIVKDLRIVGMIFRIFFIATAVCTKWRLWAASRFYWDGFSPRKARKFLVVIPSMGSKNVFIICGGSGKFLKTCLESDSSTSSNHDPYFLLTFSIRQ